MRTLKSLIITTMLFLSSMCVSANQDIQTGRYTTINPIASDQQIKILTVVVTVVFNKNVTTVGDAVSHLLLRSGYRQASLSSSDPMIPTLLNSPLPAIHRQLGPITIENALRVLAGEAWDLVVDPVNRMVSFELVEKYHQSVNNTVMSNKVFESDGSKL